MALHGMVLAGVALIAGATLAGAWISARAARMPAAALSVAGALLIAVVLGDLLPDIWRDLPGSGLAWWAAVAAAAAGFTGAGVLARSGCACASRPAGAVTGRTSSGFPPDAGPGPGNPRSGTAVGWGAAAALAVHRTLEGAAVTLAGSAAVIAVLVVHAAAEGFALTALLRSGRRRLAPFLVVACVSPAVGAVVLSTVRVPDSASVMLTCVVAGVLSRSALTAWRAGWSRPAVEVRRPAKLLRGANGGQ